MQNKINSDFNETLSNYDSLILYQKEEIIKTKSIISKFENNISKQNEALKIFLEEKRKLAEERDIIAKVTGISGNTSKLDQNKVCTESNEAEMTVLKKPKIPNISERFMLHQSNKEGLKVSISKINHRIIKTVVMYKDFIILGGCQGMLLRYKCGNMKVYDTNVLEDILQVEVKKQFGVLSLIAFTKDSVIIFKDFENFTSSDYLRLSGIGYVYNDKTTMFIPLRNGAIHIVKDRLIFSVLAMFPTIELNSFVPYDTKLKMALFTSTEGKLYKVSYSTPLLKSVDILKEIKDIRRVVHFCSTDILYCFDNEIRIVDSNLKDIGSVIFKSGIKLLDTHSNLLAVLDHDNMLHVYAFNRTDNSQVQSFSTKVTGSFTALSISTSKIVLCFEYENMILEYKL